MYHFNPKSYMQFFNPKPFVLLINNIQTYYTILYNGFGICNNNWFRITGRHVFLNNGYFKVRKIYLQKHVY
jgi:hypothetical protein